MKLKNFLIVVTDIELSKRFYREIFGLETAADFGENAVLTGGLVLQEKTVWESWIGRDVSRGGCDAELYFEESDLDGFLKKLEESPFSPEYLNRCIEHSWGQRVVRIFDPDGHVIEIGETMEAVARRFLASGMSPRETAEKTQMLLSEVENIARSMERRRLN